MQDLQVFLVALLILLFTVLTYSDSPVEADARPPSKPSKPVKPDTQTCTKCHTYPHPDKKDKQLFKSI
jgi:hypothetical protein